jgi:hypothetical protein
MIYIVFPDPRHWLWLDWCKGDSFCIEQKSRDRAEILTESFNLGFISR